MILHDWQCKDHGYFEGSHAICPAFGCMSEHVTKVFLKAVGTRSDMTKRTDAGLRKSAESFGLTNWRSARAGESSKPPMKGPNGEQVLWGNEVQKAMPGQSFAGLAQTAQQQGAQPFVTKTGQRLIAPNNGMRAAATEMGITSRNIPKAERTVAKSDMRAAS